MNFEGQYPDPLLAAAAGARREIGTHSVQGSEQPGHSHASISERVGFSTFGKNDFRSQIVTVEGGPQQVIVANGSGKQITVSIDGEESEADMKVIVFAHPGEGEERNTLVVNYSPTWARLIEESLDMILSNAEISVDQEIIPLAARTLGRMTQTEVLEVLGADNQLVELAVEILSLVHDAEEPSGIERLDDLISLSRWGDTIGGIVCTIGILKEAGIAVHSSSEAIMLLRQLQMSLKRMKTRVSQSTQRVESQRISGADTQATLGTTTRYSPRINLP